MWKDRGCKRAKDKDSEKGDFFDDQTDSNHILETQYDHSSETNVEIQIMSNDQEKISINGQMMASEPESDQHYILRKQADEFLERGQIKSPSTHRSRLGSIKDLKRRSRSESFDYSHLLGSTAFLRSEHFIHIRKEDQDQNANDRPGHNHRNTAHAVKRGRSLISSTKFPSATLNDVHNSAAKFRQESPVTTTSSYDLYQNASFAVNQMGLPEQRITTTTSFNHSILMNDSDCKKNDCSLNTTTSSDYEHENILCNQAQDIFISTSEKTMENLSRTAYVYGTHPSHIPNHSSKFRHNSEINNTPKAPSVNVIEPTGISLFNDNTSAEGKVTAPYSIAGISEKISVNHHSTVPSFNDSVEALNRTQIGSPKNNIPNSIIPDRLEMLQPHDQPTDLEGKENGGLYTTLSCQETLSTKPTRDFAENLISNLNQSSYNEKASSTIEYILKVHQLVNETKLKIMLEASKVHQGIGSDRIFANYWDSLGRYLSVGTWETESIHSHRSCTDSDLNGIELVLNSFLCTLKLRKLHNQLILGLIKQINCTFTLKSAYIQNVPSQWMNHSICPVKEKKKPSNKNTTINKKYPFENINEYLGASSGAWTASGDVNPAPVHSQGSVHQRGAVGNRLTSPTIPGVLEISSIVSSASKVHDMKMSDAAIDFLAIAVKEQVTTLLQRAIISIEESISLGFSMALIDKFENDDVATDAKRSYLHGVMHRDRRLISPWALASAVEIQSFGIISSDLPTQRRGWERCMLSANRSQH